MNSQSKIAWLPEELRDDLNNYLRDGESDSEILEWINKQKKTKAILAKQFDGEPITEQNLLDWKQNEYQDWLLDRRDCEFVSKLLERAGSIDLVSRSTGVSDMLAMTLSVELALVAGEMLKQAKDTGEKWECLKKVLDRVDQLRRADHQMKRAEKGRAPLSERISDPTK